MALLTARLFADPADPWGSASSRAAIAEAAALLRAGATVAFATETVYGLGANAWDVAALEKIFAAKQRPTWDPLIVHVADMEMLYSVVAEVPEPARLWIERFWPGPLTLLLPRSAAVPDLVTAGRARVGVRMPRHPVAQALLRAAGCPVAAPSANLFGHTSPTSAAHVLADLDGRIDAVLDGGASEHGLESTVVDACEDPCLVYRPGAVTLEQLAAVWPRVRMHQAVPGTELVKPQALPSPGVGLRHYAPRARVVLVDYDAEQSAQAWEIVREVRALMPGRVGLMLPEGLLTAEQQAQLPSALVRFPWGRWQELPELAQSLFAGLRWLDDAGVDHIVCALPAAEGLGSALCDRLRKAAMPKA
ncbi:L-threonylcarbamoyladenylate synthase [Acidipila sp. EB88]|uniref:L-threonylcarbamoyladenylate synthase n=1 Tax=Acidipila sp. EB88 TaxID=2305226 RepID=UPI000F5FA5D2|nr:L-threonylcarbamoyladenylate synthase [Acidipila sp. EB88]RRA47190.1 threonylcarbamoyl-AMP synthase [Acidipila sp. EB88]